MTRYALEHVLAGTRGELRGSPTGELSFTRLERDARNVTAGDLYVGVRGERFDGNAFTPDAIRSGAAAALVSRQWADANPDPGVPLVVVDDTVEALQRWARWRRGRLDVTVVGVTGSIGKTSAKESIAAVLGQVHKVYKSPGSFNNEIGLPLSLLEAEDDVERMVLEMGGAYAFHELTLLAGIAKPQVGVVTNVHPVHLERMGTIEAIAETKSELVRALPPEGIAVLNGDDERVRAMAGMTRARVVQYGLESSNEVRASSVSTEGLDGVSFWLTAAGERHFVRVPFAGPHGVQVALVALATGYALGLDFQTMQAGLRDARIQVRLRQVAGPSGSHLIDDTYNASTPSVLSALALLAEVPARRRIAVLGDMRELGPITEDEHRTVGIRTAEVADVLLTYGELARTIAEAALECDRRTAVLSFALGQQEELVSWLRSELRSGDVVLLKGSRGLAMETMVSDLEVPADNLVTANGGHERAAS